MGASDWSWLGRDLSLGGSCAALSLSVDWDVFGRCCVVCVACCKPVSAGISKKFKGAKTKVSTVLPNCEDENCLKFIISIDKGSHKGWICICKRPKKESKEKISNERNWKHEEAKQRMNEAKKLKAE